MIKQLNEAEMGVVNGAGKDGFEAGYKAAKALGANEVQAVAAGVLASMAEDALDSVTGN